MRVKFRDDYAGESDFGDEPTDNAIAKAFSSGLGDGTIHLDSDEDFNFSDNNNDDDDDDDDDGFTRKFGCYKLAFANLSISTGSCHVNSSGMQRT